MVSKIRQLFSKIMNMLLLAILEIIIGLFMLISPSGLAIGLLIVVGGLLVANGVVRCIAYFKEPVQESQKTLKFASGLFLVVSGLFFLFNFSFVVGIFPVLAALYGLLAMLSVFLKTEMIISMIRQKNYIWYVMACSLLFSLFAMIVLYGSKVPFVGAAILFFFAAALDVVYYLHDQKKISLPTFKALIHSITTRIFKKSKDITNPVPVEQNKQETTVDSVKSQDHDAVISPEPSAQEHSDTASSANVQPEKTNEEVDPADEDLSWANVPQLKMPE